MCQFPMFPVPPPYGYRERVHKRTVVKYSRLHRYATDRWGDSRSVMAAKFWWGVRCRCEEEIEIRKLERIE